MSHAWYQLIPEVHIYTDIIPESSWSDLLTNTRSNLTFHGTDAFAHYSVGTEWEFGWNDAQSRHLRAIADIYARYPNKHFYIILDDDTFLLPSNLLHTFETINPELIHSYGVVYTAISYSHPFYHHNDTGHYFTHGGGGIILSQGLMKHLGPRLRNCSEQLEIAILGSDIRLAICISHTSVNGILLDSDKVHQQIASGFHSDMPDVVLQMSYDRPEGPQLTFHHVTDENVAVLFNGMITEFENDYYLDWSSISYRWIDLELWGIGMRFWFVVNYMIGSDFKSKDGFRAEEGIKKADVGFANYSQKYEGDVWVYYRCNEQMNEGELGLVGEPPPPIRGVVFNVRCPEPKKWIHQRMKEAPKQYVFEEVGDW
jgi:hypothetical protein